MQKFWVYLPKEKKWRKLRNARDLSWLSKYLLMDFRIGTMLPCTLRNKFSEAGHFECSRGSQAPQSCICVRYAVCLSQPIFQLGKESSWPPLWLRFLYLHVSDVHQHTFSWSRIGHCSNTLKAYKTCVYIRRGSCCRPILEWLTGACSW